MKNTVKIIVLIFFIQYTQESLGQVAVTSYSIYAIGVNTNQTKMVNGELKLFMNRDYNKMISEIDIFYNFKARKYHKFSIGIGFSIKPFSSSDQVQAFVIPASIEIYPLQEFKRLTLLIEFAPEFIKKDDVHLRHLWGIRYKLGDF